MYKEQWEQTRNGAGMDKDQPGLNQDSWEWQEWTRIFTPVVDPFLQESENMASEYW
jgi:hypothetical protein